MSGRLSSGSGNDGRLAAWVAVDPVRDRTALREGRLAVAILVAVAVGVSWRLYMPPVPMLVLLALAFVVLCWALVCLCLLPFVMLTFRSPLYRARFLGAFLPGGQGS